MTSIEITSSHYYNQSPVWASNFQSPFSGILKSPIPPQGFEDSFLVTSGTHALNNSLSFVVIIDIYGEERTNIFNIVLIYFLLLFDS